MYGTLNLEKAEDQIISFNLNYYNNYLNIGKLQRKIRRSKEVKKGHKESNIRACSNTWA